MVNRKEIDSHSSQKTNELISDLKQRLWKQSAMLIGSTLSTKEAQLGLLEYFGTVMTYYMETCGIIEERGKENDKIDNQKINEILQKEFMTVTAIQMSGGAPLTQFYELRRKTLLCHYMINLSLQKMRYFFRVGNVTPKGIDSALELFGSPVENESEWNKNEQ